MPPGSGFGLDTWNENSEILNRNHQGFARGNERGIAFVYFDGGVLPEPPGRDNLRLVLRRIFGQSYIRIALPFPAELHPFYMRPRATGTRNPSRPPCQRLFSRVRSI